MNAKIYVSGPFPLSAEILRIHQALPPHQVSTLNSRPLLPWTLFRFSYDSLQILESLSPIHHISVIVVFRGSVAMTLSRSRSLSLLLTCTTLLTQSFVCEGPQGPGGPPGPGLTGTITGFCRLYDTDNDAIDDQSGVAVSIEGTAVSTTTSADGRFTLTDVPSGIHILRYFKQGFGIWKDPDLQFVGGGTIYVDYTYLYAKPLYNVANLSATTSAGSINITGSLSGTLPTGYRQAIVFFDTTSSVSADPSHYLFELSTYIPNTSSTLLLITYSYDWEQHNIQTGDRLYFKAYGATSTSAYFDLNTLRYVHPFISDVASNTASTQVP